MATVPAFIEKKNSRDQEAVAGDATDDPVDWEAVADEDDAEAGLDGLDGDLGNFMREHQGGGGGLHED